MRFIPGRVNNRTITKTQIKIFKISVFSASYHTNAVIKELQRTKSLNFIAF